MSFQACLQDVPALTQARCLYLSSPPPSVDPSELCEEHGEVLSMFCLDDLEPLCEQCAEERHAEHRAYQLTDAALDCKEELETSLKELNVKLIHYRGVSQTRQQAFRYNQAEAELTEEHVKREFETLHQFLEQEEAGRLQALREERGEKMRAAEERRDEINQVIKSLEEKIRLAEEVIDAGGDGSKFLQDYKDTLNSSSMADRKPQKIYRPLINVAKHLGNLQYAVWEKMRDVAPLTPVTLDSRTAGPSLEVSSGLSSVLICPEPSLQTSGGAVDALENPERFHPSSCILGTEGFSSGVHSWTVEVGYADNWTLGVAAQWVRRKVEVEVCPAAGLWCIGRRERTYQALATPPKILRIKNAHSLRKVRMMFNWEEGTLTFADAVTNEHLYTFTHRFSEVVFPYFESAAPGGSLALLPQRVNVSVELDCEPGEDPLLISEEERKKNKLEPTMVFFTSLIDDDCEMINGYSTDDKKPKPKPKPKSRNSTNNNKTAAKKQTNKKRFNVTYHVSLNRALNDTHDQNGYRENADN
ncbi:unnamed protein product [Ophioblennius macclurei]